MRKENRVENEKSEGAEWYKGRDGPYGCKKIKGSGQGCEQRVARV